MNPQQRDYNSDWDPDNPDNKYDGFYLDSARKKYERALGAKDGLIISGAIIVGSAVLFGYIIPFFHHKPNSTNVSQINFPFNLELVSSNNQSVNGFKILYKMRLDLFDNPVGCLTSPAKYRSKARYFAFFLRKLFRNFVPMVRGFRTTLF